MNIAIIGAGAAGLAAAWDLARAGHEVAIYEAGAEVGGLAAGFKDPAWDWSLEKFYHHWFSNDDSILGLLDEIGCRERVRFYTPTTSIWRARGIFPMDKAVTPVALLSRAINVLGIPDLPLLAKLRFGAVGFLLTLYKNGVALEKHTADAWLRRWVGDAAYEAIWRPLLIGKFSENYAQVNMAWMWARLYKRTAQLGTYVGGFQAALEDIAAAVRGAGVAIHLNTRVGSIKRRPDQAGQSEGETGGPTEGETRGLSPLSGGLEVDAGANGGRFDRVLVTAGPGLLLKLVPDLPDPYAAQVRDLRSIGAIALILALRHQLMTDGTYWLNLPAQSPDRRANPFPFLALVEHTNYLPPEHFGGDRIVYLGDYVAPDHEYFSMSEDEIADLFLPSLTKVNPNFSPDWVRKRWLFRAPYAQPVPLVNQSQRIPPIRTPIDGLYWASMSQVYPWDRGTNYAVEIGRRAAAMMLEARG